MKQYCNMQGYTDVKPYEVVRVVSDKCIEIKLMNVEKNPNWQPEFEAGGFSAHCTNQREQEWIITSSPEAIPFKVRKRKDKYGRKVAEGTYWHQTARYVLSDKPVYFYDYNF